MRQHPVSILFEQYSRERRMRVMRLYAESTFDVDSYLKSWLEKAYWDNTRRARPKAILQLVEIGLKAKGRWYG